MTEITPDAPGPEYDEIRRVTLGVLVEYASMYLGIQENERRVASCLENVSDTAQPIPSLIEVANGLDLRSTRVQMDPKDAMRSITHDDGMLWGHVPGTEAEWVVLRRGGKTKVEALHIRRMDVGQWTLDSPHELAELMGTADAIDWVIVEPNLLLHQMQVGYKEEPDPKRAMRRLIRLLTAEREALFSVCVYAMLVGVLSLVTPLAVQVIVNTISFGMVIQPLVVVAIVLFIGLVFLGILRVTQHYVVEFVQRRIFVRLSLDLARRLPRVTQETREHYDMPELVNRFFDVITVQKALSSLFLDGIGLFLQMGIGMLVLGFYHPYLLVFDALLIISVLFVMFAMGRGAVAASLNESHAKYEVVAWLEEVARHPLSFKSTHGEWIATHQSEKRTMTWLSARRKHFRIVIGQIAGASSIQALSSAGVLGLGGYLVIKGELTLGQLVAAELIVTAVAASVGKMGKHLETYYDLVTGVHKVGKLLDLPLERSYGDLPCGAEVAAKVNLENAMWKTGELSLKVNMQIRSGERLGLTGDDLNTWALLLDGVYGLKNTVAGRVIINDRELSRIELKSLREHVVLARTEDSFEGTVEENVRVGRYYLSPSEVSESLERLGLLEEVNHLGKGIQTHLLPNGWPLSQAQLRRLTLARTLMVGPRLVLLDRMLDSFSPQEIETVMDVLCEHRKWTVVVVTSRKEVLERCDRVLVLEKGEIREQVSQDGTVTPGPQKEGT